MNNKLVVLDPVGDIKELDRRPVRQLESLEKKRVIFLWGMHQASLKFWPVFEETIVAMYRPTEVHRLHKDDRENGRLFGNTWTPAPEHLLKALAEKADYALIGVGA
jgi:hypothetical protein